MIFIFKYDKFKSDQKTKEKLMSSYLTRLHWGEKNEFHDEYVSFLFFTLID